VDGKTYQPGETAEIPDVGTITIGSNGKYTFTPVPNWNGKVPTVDYTVSDGKHSTSSTLDIEVTPENDPVTAGDDGFTTGEDTPVPLNLLDNDEAPDGGLRITTINGEPVTPGIEQNIPITDDGTPDGNVIGKVVITPE